MKIVNAVTLVVCSFVLAILAGCDESNPRLDACLIRADEQYDECVVQEVIRVGSGNECLATKMLQEQSCKYEHEGY